MRPLKQIGIVCAFFFSFLLVYHALLQYYPFTDLPVSDSVKKIFKEHVTDTVHWGGLLGIGYILFDGVNLTIILFFRTIILIAMHFSPAFRAGVEEYCEARRATRLQALQEYGEPELPRSSKCAIIIDWIFNFKLFCVISIGNDVVFNRSEETSFFESATSRISSNASLMASVIALGIFVLFIFVLVRVAAGMGQNRLEGNEELMIGTGAEERMTVQATTFNGLEEKFIELLIL